MTSDLALRLPSTVPSSCTSPSLVTLPMTRKFWLMMEGMPLPELVTLTPVPFPLDLENILLGLHEFTGVDGFAVEQNLVVQMRAGAAPGRADGAELVAHVDRLAHLDGDRRHMAVAR